MKLVIIKLGGSVITNKDASHPTPRLKTIANLAKEVGKLYRSNQYQIILVQGNGSFGHPQSKKHRLHLGMQTPEQKLAFCQVANMVVELNSLLIKALLAEKVPAVSLLPRSFVKTFAGSMKGFDYSLAQSYLAQNQVPVLAGDAVLDQDWNCFILSGDTVISYLAKELKANKVIFLSDVNGVYTSNPKKNPQARLIPLITNRNFKEVLVGLTPSGRDDISGEMKGKVLELRKHLKGVEVLITNGLSDGSLLKAVGQYPSGTKLRFD